VDSTSVEVQNTWRRIYAPASPEQSLTTRLLHNDRAWADVQAAWLRWHQPSVAERFAPNERSWYALFERARVETLAGAHLPGMRANLTNLRQLAPATALAGHLYCCARQLLAGTTLADAELRLPDAAVAMLCPPRRFNWWRRPGLERLLQTALLPSLRNSRPHLQDADLFAEALRPLIELLTQTNAGESSSAQWLAQAAIDDASLTLANVKPGQGDAGAEQTYRVFSRVWDECLDARQLRADSTAGAQHALTPAQQADARRLARRLQQRLLALQVRQWDDEQEHGVLDRRRLASMVTSGNRQVFRQQREQLVPRACVTLLLDQSGSMRGLPWALTLQAVDLAVQVLETCGVRSEVLAFSTRFTADNPLRQEWEAAGCPPAPGRLNAVRHAVYKPTDRPWRYCRQSLLCQPPSEGENIDGEALQWAASRLLRQPEQRKILIVLSDGIPFDEATAHANGRCYLEDHLHHSIAQIEASAVHLAAIGSGQGVTRYYRRALVLKQANQVSALLFEQLADLLTRPGQSKGALERPNGHRD
jgi:cobaltochelatase CobT